MGSGVVPEASIPTASGFHDEVFGIEVGPALILVLSNLFAVFPLAYALSLRLWPEFSLVAAQAVISMVHHACSSSLRFCLDLVASQIQNLDHLFALILIAWFALYFARVDLRFRVAVSWAVFVLIIPGVFNARYHFWASLAVGLAAAGIFVWTFLWRSSKGYRFVPQHVTAMAVLALIAISLFLAADGEDIDNFGWLHSSWHAAVFMLVFYVMLTAETAVGPKETPPRKTTSGTEIKTTARRN